MIKAIINFILRLLGFKPKNENVTTIVEENKNNSEEVVEDTTTSTDDITTSTTTEEDNTKTDESNNSLLTFTDDEVEMLKDIIRPLIKDLNNSDVYEVFCNIIVAAGKTLKTYATLSEDKTTLTITLTQSHSFNILLSEFIEEHLMATFKATIDAEWAGKYDITIDDNGTIVIKKIG